MLAEKLQGQSLFSCCFSLFIRRNPCEYGNLSAKRDEIPTFITTNKNITIIYSIELGIDFKNLNELK